ncbi:DUF4148 domain-containing protein [Paraburkholderia sediminicola]|uniref:DUF4148 domain-containing protein n=1 Tax=Paraburkholderia sediminicola TaxID=458836 RepID=UPI0038B9634E
MKLLTAIAVAALSLPFGANAFAQSNSSGLTRAEVIAQLQQAQAEGVVPTSNNDYPPTAREIARNREIYAIQHADGAGAVKTAGASGDQAQAASN